MLRVCPIQIVPGYINDKESVFANQITEFFAFLKNL